MPSLLAPIAWVVPGHAAQGLAGRAPDAPAAPAAARQAGDHIQRLRALRHRAQGAGNQRSNGATPTTERWRRETGQKGLHRAPCEAK